MNPAPPPVSLEKFLSAKEVGAHLGVSSDCVLKWWHQGLPGGGEIPRDYVRRRGFVGWLFHPHLVAYLQEQQSRRD